MKKPLRRAGFVSLTVGALGCGEPASSVPANPNYFLPTETVSTDSLKGQEWRRYLDAMKLHQAWVPGSDSPWRPFYKPTLVAAIATVQSAAMPIRTADMAPAEAEAAKFAGGVNLDNSAIFVDLVGEESVQWSAALRGQGLVPILTINNWPHPAGLLRLERPLGALLYYAAEAAAAPRVKEARPVFMLERSRLGQKGPNPSAREFDNRYFHVATDFPSAAALKAQGITRILYVNPQGIYAGCESDDLNEYFASLSDAGLRFSYIKPGRETFEMVDAVVPKSRSTIFMPQALAEYSSSPTYTHHYYHSYTRYSYWHSTYWSSSSGAWGSSSGSSYGSSS